MKIRLGLAVVLLLLAALAGLWLSGWTTVQLLKLDIPIQWNTWWQYYQAIDLPQLKPYVWKVKLGAGVGFGLSLLLWLPLAVLLLKPREREQFDSSFATKGVLAKHKVLGDDPTGIIAATRFGGQFVSVKDKHLLLAASTRSGKGVSTVMTNALHWRHSMVILDVKQECYDETAGWRGTLGPVYMFDPFTASGRSHRWNPLGYVSLDPIQRSSDIEAIASSLYKETSGTDPFWMHASRAAFQAMCEWLFDLYLDDLQDETLPDQMRTAWPTLGAVYRLLSIVGGARQSKQEAFRELMERPFAGEKARTGLGNLVGLAEQTFSSVIATTQAPLRIFGNPIVDAATSDNDFDLHSLRRRVQTIHVGVPPSKLVEAKGILNLFFEQAIKLNGTTLPAQDKALKYQCMFLLDEFSALGEMSIVPVAMGWLAGYGVRLVIVIQSFAQLEAVYGPEVARSMAVNAGAQAIFTPREQRDAEEFSRMLGETTVRRKQRTRAYGQHGNVSVTEIVERRPLMSPDEIKALPPDKAIVMIEGVGHPIKGEKIFYYKDAYFKRRLLKAPEVPMLDLNAGKDKK